MKKANKTKAPEASAAKTGKELAARPSTNRQLQQSGGSVGGRGFENIDRKDILLPRVKLLQQMSPEVTGDLGMKAGTMLVGLTNKNLGTKIIITPILHFRSRIKWVKQDEGGGIECSSPDGRKPLTDLVCTECGLCPHKEWNDSKKGKDQMPQCTLYENFLVLIGDSKEPVLLPMERTKLRAARKFYSMGALKNSDMWNWQYELSVVKETNEKDQAYFNYTVTDLAKPTSENVRTLCENLWSSLRGKTIAAEQQDRPDDQAAAPAAGTPPDGKF